MPGGKEIENNLFEIQKQPSKRRRNVRLYRTIQEGFCDPELNVFWCEMKKWTPEQKQKILRRLWLRLGGHQSTAKEVLNMD